MELDVDWRHGEDHMRTGHQITVQAADEAPPILMRCCSTPTQEHVMPSARVIGYSPAATAVLVVILVRREDKPGSWRGANGWRANSTDRRIYAEGTERHE
jgi:hypothetical protein